MKPQNRVLITSHYQWQICRASHPSFLFVRQPDEGQLCNAISDRHHPSAPTKPLRILPSYQRLKAMLNFVTTSFVLSPASHYNFNHFTTSQQWS